MKITKRMRMKKRMRDEDYYGIDNPFLLHSYDRGKEQSLLRLFGFTKQLSTYNPSIKKESKK